MEKTMKMGTYTFVYKELTVQDMQEQSKLASLSAKKDAVQKRMESAETPEMLDKWYESMVKVDSELTNTTLALAKSVVIEIDGKKGDDIPLRLLIDAVTMVIEETVPQEKMLKKSEPVSS